MQTNNTWAYDEEQWLQFDTTKPSTGPHIQKGQERYWWISDHGRVKMTNNYNDHVKWPKVSLTGGHEGSRYAALSPNYLLNKYVHKLVAIMFCSNPFGITTGRSVTVDHIDGNKTNNHYTNLEWVTAKENRWRYQQRKNNNEWFPSEQSIIPPDTTRQELDATIKDLYRAGLGITGIQHRLGITQSRVWRPVKELRNTENITGNNKKRGGSPYKL
tara:strand:+ start:390 stop:1034 length:645 start_codon:yes stop_codon:yes gene_type:complete